MLESPDLEILEASSGPAFEKLRQAAECDLAILDLQVGSMGAMAICLDLRHAESYGAADHIPVLMLLDRRPDVFLARRSGAEGFVVKPLDPLRVRRAVHELLKGGTFEDDAWKPATVRVGASDIG
jgi:DNA-binding response OmpR family regulator